MQGSAHSPAIIMESAKLPAFCGDMQGACYQLNIDDLIDEPAEFEK
jgi:hypothetical protein